MQVRIARNICLIDLLLCFFKPLFKFLLADFRHQEQKFISAITDQGVFITHTVSDHQHQRFQYRVPGIVTAGIVVELEIIEVNHGYAALLSRSLDLIFIVAPVVSTGQGINVEFIVVAVQLVLKLIPPLRVNEAVVAHMTHQFHDTWLSIHFHIAGRYFIKIIFFIFQFGPLYPVLINFSGNTVFTGLALLPVVIATTMVQLSHLIFFCLIVSSQTKIHSIQQTHHRKHFAVKIHLFLGLLPRQFIV